MHNFLCRFQKKMFKKLSEFKFKKISGELKVAMVSQPPQTIGLVPVGSWLCMLSFKTIGQNLQNLSCKHEKHSSK